MSFIIQITLLSYLNLLNRFENEFFSYRVNDRSSTIRSKEINAFYSGRLSEYDLVEIQVHFIPFFFFFFSFFAFRNQL